MKKVLLATNKLSIGGAETVVLNQANLLDKTKFEVYLGVLYECSNDNTFFSQLTLPVNNIIHFGSLKRSPWRILPWWKAYTFLKEKKIDIVVTNLFDTNMVVRSAAILAGVPTIISVEHSTYNEKRLWQKLVDRLLAFSTDIIFGVSKEVIDFTVKQEHIHKDKFQLLPQLVNMSFSPIFTREGARKQLDIPSDAFVCITVGRFSPEKAQHKIIKIADIVHSKGFGNIYFLIVGYGFLEEKLRKQIRELNMEKNIKVISDAKRAREYMISGDVFLLTSDREGLGLVILEAMAQGLVPVAAKVGGVLSLIEDSKDGFLLPPENLSGFAEKIIFLANNPLSLGEMSKAATERVKNNSKSVTHFERIILQPSNKQ